MQIFKTKYRLVEFGNYDTIESWDIQKKYWWSPWFKECDFTCKKNNPEDLEEQLNKNLYKPKNRIVYLET